MSWAVGYDAHWCRDIGYGVPAICDHSVCGAEIHRGLAYVCGGEPYGGEEGCGLFFCSAHRVYLNDKPQCVRCAGGKEPFTPAPDTAEWIAHKLTDPTWQGWRDENPAEVERLRTPSVPAATGAEP